MKSVTFLRAAAIAALIVTAMGVSRISQAAPKGTKKANPRIEMVVADRGTVVCELFTDKAPKTVSHLLALIDKKFFDGILFHRVVAGFVAQAGDPASKTVDGTKIAKISPEDAAGQYNLGGGGSGSTVPLEAGAPHDRGTLGLARTEIPDSGDSQFFINLASNNSLDNKYCLFGKVVKGMDVVDKIRQGDRITSIRAVPPKKK